MRNPFSLNPSEISGKAKNIRQSIIYMNSTAGAGHTGADLSETDILASLYFNILGYDPDNLKDPERDRFILSKGHGVGGYYCTLAEAGILDKSQLDSYLKKDSLLPGHPVRQKTPGIEFNTGALGHGLPAAAGLALAAKKQNKTYKTIVLLGDGELEEGSNWEASMAAAHFQLDNLIVIVDRNGLQLADRTEIIMALEPLDRKFESFGYSVQKIDGNNPEEIIDAVELCTPGGGKPHLILASTTKGKGVSFIEDQPAWHHKIPVGDEIKKAIEELE
ncbi:MAG: transketolase [Spirochaetales bacterium]|nr:transketolase [Spirochaetales bacterium]